MAKKKGGGLRTFLRLCAGGKQKSWSTDTIADMAGFDKNAPVRRRDCAFGKKDLTAYLERSMFEVRNTNMARIVLFAGLMSTSTTIHPMNVTRRSFYAVGQSCVINLNPTQSQSGHTAHVR